MAEAITYFEDNYKSQVPNSDITIIEHCHEAS